MPIAYIAQEIWRWIAETGINLALLVLLAMLIPRAGRFANRMAEKQVHESGDTDEGKTRLAIAGVGINIAQIVAFFLLLVFFLQQIGFSLVGATLPATVVSAAIGFGAQSIIADFLAGFFILTEKQYGVGDFVTFEGNGVEVSGDVIQITMRSTHIRTIEQSTVSIPNSTARICINHSNYWSSALVVIPVPLLGSTSADEATARAERAARRVLADPEIAKIVLGDLSVHPAVAVTPPVVVGMPWTMDVRFLVRVEPLSQWMVERAIRIAVLNEFWEEYGSAPTMAGTRLDRVVDHTVTGDAYPPTEFMPPVHAQPETQTSEAATTVMPGAHAKASNDGETELLTQADDDPATDALDPTADDAADGEPEPRGIFGGLMRVSTGVLLAAFAVLLLARGLTLGATEENPDQSGVLAPPPRSAVTSPSATEPEPAPATHSPTSAATSHPAPTDTPTGETAEPTPPAQEPGGTDGTPATSQAPAPTTGRGLAPGDGGGASPSAGAPATATQAPR